MNGVITDLRYAGRRLAATPGFTAVAAATLALGMAATTAIYSVVDALMFRPLPYQHQHRLADIWFASPGGISTRSVVPAQLAAWRVRASPVFDAIEPYANRSASLTGGEEPEHLVGAALGGGLMTMLGVTPALGRGITEADAQPGRDQVVVLSDDLWRRRFGADPAAVGQTVRLDDQLFEIVGVMPPAFRFPAGRRQFWVPLVLDPAAPRRFDVAARLRPGLSRAGAQARLDAIAAGESDAAILPRGVRVEVRPPLARHLNASVRTALVVLMGAVSCVMLIACANLANLVLVQGAGRGRELAVRAALGASRRRLLRHLLTESLVLAAAGGLLGLILAQWAIDLLAAFTPRDMTFLSAEEIRLDGRVLAFAVALVCTTAVFFGLLPAVQGARTGPDATLKETRRGATGSPRLEHLRRGFVVLQLAISLVLLVGAGLLARTFAHVTAIDPGFQPATVVALDLSLPHWRYPTRDAQRVFFDRVLERMRVLPGVVGATVTGGPPPGGGGISFGLTFEIDGRGVVLDDPALLLPFSEVDGNFFEVMGIPLKAGRTFGPGDAPEGPTTIVISESMARRLWKGDDPVGQRLRLGPERPWHTVVGIVGDVYQLEHAQPRGLFALYYPNTQSRGIPAQQTLVVRTAMDPAAMIPSIREQVWSVDRDQPFTRITTLDDAYAEFFARPRFYAFLMTAFAAVGLAITAVGLYGVLAFGMVQRTREFGIRMALGAGRGDVLRLVFGAGLPLVATGLALGAGGSLLVTRALESLLVEIPRTDPVTYALTTAALGGVALVACWIPARRATRLDPVIALRCE